MVIFRMEQQLQNGNIVSIPGWDIHLENAFLDGRPFQIGGHHTNR